MPFIQKKPTRSPKQDQQALIDRTLTQIEENLDAADLAYAEGSTHAMLARRDLARLRRLVFPGGDSPPTSGLTTPSEPVQDDDDYASGDGGEGQASQSPSALRFSSTPNPDVAEGHETTPEGEDDPDYEDGSEVSPPRDNLRRSSQGRRVSVHAQPSSNTLSVDPTHSSPPIPAEQEESSEDNQSHPLLAPTGMPRQAAQPKRPWAVANRITKPSSKKHRRFGSGSGSTGSAKSTKKSRAFLRSTGQNKKAKK